MAVSQGMNVTKSVQRRTSGGIRRASQVFCLPPARGGAAGAPLKAKGSFNQGKEKKQSFRWTFSLGSHLQLHEDLLMSDSISIASHAYILQISLRGCIAGDFPGAIIIISG